MQIETSKQKALENDNTLIQESLDSCITYIDTIAENFTLATNMYAKNEFEKGHNKFADTVNLLDLFIQLISKISNLLTDRTNQTEFKQTIKQHEVELLSIIKAMYQAQKKSDVVMLSDLIEHELIDNLTQWKIQILPFLNVLIKKR